jgi:hypothetical protein
MCEDKNMVKNGPKVHSFHIGVNEKLEPGNGGQQVRACRLSEKEKSEYQTESIRYVYRDPKNSNNSVERIVYVRSRENSVNEPKNYQETYNIQDKNHAIVK